MKLDLTPQMDAFIQEAKAVSIVEGFERAGYGLASLRRQGSEHVGPCPVCGGTDRFSINPAKSAWYCRGSEHGGHDGISLVRYLEKTGFLDACEVVTGRERPGQASAEDRRETERRRRQAEARRQQLLAEAEEKARKQEEQSRWYREREWERCRADWRDGLPFHGSAAERYLAARYLDPTLIDGSYLRCHPALGYWGKGSNGADGILHRGPAMLCLFVRPASDRFEPIGLHRTWIDLEAEPKFRPIILDPLHAGETLPTKKMRGSKSGGLLPVAGRYSRCRRMVAGEGIETVIGYAMREGARDDTFYCAAGDLGNLCGKADRGSRIRHPHKFRVSASGRRSPVFVPGDVPDMASAALPVPDHVSELVLLGDGDSDAVATRAAMKRGALRHARPGRTVIIDMAPAGRDFAEVVA